MGAPVCVRWLPRAPVKQIPPWPQRGNAEQGGGGEQRGQPVAAPPAPPQRAAEPKAVPPQAVPPAAAAQAPSQRGAQPKVAPPPQGASPGSAAQQQPAPEVGQRGQKARPAEGKQNDKKRRQRTEARGREPQGRELVRSRVAGRARSEGPAQTRRPFAISGCATIRQLCAIGSDIRLYCGGLQELGGMYFALARRSALSPRSLLHWEGLA